MKTSVKFFAFFFVVALLAACAGGESETFAKIRTMQADQVKSLNEMTTTLDGKIAKIKSKIEMSGNMDSTLMANMDSVSRGTIQTDIAGANEIYAKLTALNSELETLKGDVTSKMIPSVEEMAKGAENPFKGVKDEELLTTFKGYQEKIEAMKSQVFSEL